MSSSTSSTSRPGSCSNRFPLTKKVLEEILGKKVNSYTITPGSSDSYEFLSSVFALEVLLEEYQDAKDENSNRIFVMAKIQPVNKRNALQFVNEMNLFWRELDVYGVYIPRVIGLQKRLGIPTEDIIMPPHPDCIGGNSLNYSKLLLRCTNVEEITKLHLEMRSKNVILMIDHKKTHGFETVDKRIPLDFGHISLAIKELAKIHSLGWCYKQGEKLSSLISRHPFLAHNIFQHQAVLETLSVNFNLVLAILNKLELDPRITRAIKKIKYTGLSEIVKSFLPIHGIIDETKVCRYMASWSKNRNGFFPEPWTVSCHGDCCITNMLFKCGNEALNVYPIEDPNFFSKVEASPPTEMMFVDLQYYREGCPTTDLAFLVYNSTTKEFREEHTNTLLQIYHDQFLEVCQHLNVAPLPKFTIENLKWRFKRAKIFGFLMACLNMPSILVSQDDVDAQPPEEAERFRNTQSFKLLEERMVGIVQELMEDEVF